MSDDNNNNNGKEGESLSLPPGWSKGYSRSQKKTYYCHVESKHTQWHFPTASEAADPLKAIDRAKQNRDKEANRRKRRQEVERPRKDSMHHHDSQSNNTLGDILSSVPQVISSTKTTSRMKRPRTISKSSGNSGSIDFSDSTCPAIIVPYRDLHAAQNRAKHLSQFLPHLHRFLGKQLERGTIRDYHIYIIEQSDDGRKFNRGKLLNIGFDLARKNKIRSALPHDVFIFHDVDLLPGDDLASSYTRFPTSPLHIARVWDRYSNNPKYFGGIVSFSSSDMKRINGYPNTFWGWGGEDDEMQKRCEKLGIKWDSPPHGSIIDLEQMNLTEKLAFLRSNKSWKCMVKWEALDEHETTWRTNGLADLTYQILKVTDLPYKIPSTNNSKNNNNSQLTNDSKIRASMVHTDVKLNNNHWANDKCGTDYMGH